MVATAVEENTDDDNPTGDPLDPADDIARETATVTDAFTVTVDATPDEFAGGPEGTLLGEPQLDETGTGDDIGTDDGDPADNPSDTGLLNIEFGDDYEPTFKVDEAGLNANLAGWTSEGRPLHAVADAPDADGNVGATVYATNSDGSTEAVMTIAFGGTAPDYSYTVTLLDNVDHGDQWAYLAKSGPSGTWTHPVALSALANPGDSVAIPASNDRDVDFASLGTMPNGDAAFRVGNGGDTEVTWTLNVGGTSVPVTIPAGEAVIVNMGDVVGQGVVLRDGTGQQVAVKAAGDYPMSVEDALDLTVPFMATDANDYSDPTDNSDAIHASLTVTLTDDGPVSGPVEVNGTAHEAVVAVEGPLVSVIADYPRDNGEATGALATKDGVQWVDPDSGAPLLQINNGFDAPVAFKFVSQPSGDTVLEGMAPANLTSLWAADDLMGAAGNVVMTFMVDPEGDGSYVQVGGTKTYDPSAQTAPFDNESWGDLTEVFATVTGSLNFDFGADGPMRDAAHEGDTREPANADAVDLHLTVTDGDDPRTWTLVQDGGDWYLEDGAGNRLQSQGDDIVVTPVFTAGTAGQPGSGFVSSQYQLVGTADGTDIFTITVDEAGDFSVAFHAPVDHPDEGETDGDDPLNFNLSATITDNDGDSHTTGVATVQYLDDGPWIDVSLANGEQTTLATLALDESYDNAGITGDETDRYGASDSSDTGFDDDDTKHEPGNEDGKPFGRLATAKASQREGDQSELAALFDVDSSYGADGPGGITHTFSLELSGGDGKTGGVMTTLKTLDGESIWLFMQGDKIWGRVGNDPSGEKALLIRVKEETSLEDSQLVVKQYLPFQGTDDEESHDEALPLTLAEGGTLALKLSATIEDFDEDGNPQTADRDSDSASVMLADGQSSSITFDDDGPQVSVEAGSVLYLADNNTDTIYRVDLDPGSGNAVATEAFNLSAFGDDPDQIDPHMAVSPGGRYVYVINSNTGDLGVFDSHNAGDGMQVVGNIGITGTPQLACDANGDLFIGKAGNNTVYKLPVGSDPDLSGGMPSLIDLGKVEIAKDGGGTITLNLSGADLAFGADGALYIATRADANKDGNAGDVFRIDDLNPTSGGLTGVLVPEYDASNKTTGFALRGDEALASEGHGGNNPDLIHDLASGDTFQLVKPDGSPFDHEFGDLGVAPPVSSGPLLRLDETVEDPATGADYDRLASGESQQGLIGDKDDVFGEAWFGEQKTAQGANGQPGALASLFNVTVDYGTDGPGTIAHAFDLALIVDGTELPGSERVETALSATDTGEAIYLQNNGGVIEGVFGASDTLAFTISLENATSLSDGQLVVRQYAAIEHEDTTDSYDEAALLTLLAGKGGAASLDVTLTTTVTDGDADKDEASASVTLAGSEDGAPALISFEDDGPAITGAAPEVPAVTVTNWDGEASWNNALGYFVDDGAGNPLDGTGYIIWGNASNDNFEATHTIEGYSKDQIKFFIVPDGYDVNDLRDGDVVDLNDPSLTWFAEGGGQTWDGTPGTEPPNWDDDEDFIGATDPDGKLYFGDDAGDDDFSDVQISWVEGTVSGVNAIVDEDGLADGLEGGPEDVFGIGTTATGVLNLDYGTDGPADGSGDKPDGDANAFAFTMLGGVDLTGATDTSGVATGLMLSETDEPLLAFAINTSGSTLGGLVLKTAGGVEALTITVMDNGEGASPRYTYDVDLLEPLEHEDNAGADDPNVEDDLLLSLGYRIADGDGDTADGTMAVLVDDDTPVAHDDETACIVEGAADDPQTDADESVVTGNVLANDDVGADQPGSVVSFTYTDANGDQQTADAGETVTTQYGILMIEADGSYTYTPKASVDHSATTTVDVADTAQAMAFTVFDGAGFDPTTFSADGTLNETGDGVGVQGGQSGNNDGGAKAQIAFDPSSGQTQGLVFDLGQEVLSAQAGINRLYESEGNNSTEVGHWWAYDAGGALVGNGVFSGAQGTSGNGGPMTVSVNPGQSFQYLVFTAEDYLPDNSQNGSSDYFVQSLSYEAPVEVSEQVTYTMSDADTDQAGATLTFCVKDGEGPTVVVTNETDTALEVREDALQDGTDPDSDAETDSTGLVTFQAGSDPIAGFAFGGSGGIMVDTGLEDSPAPALVWVGAGTDTMTGYLDGAPALRLTLTTPNTGAGTVGVTAELLEAWPHQDVPNASDLTVTGVQVIATDTDGSTAAAMVDVTVVDDEPEALGSYDVGEVLDNAEPVSVALTDLFDMGADGLSETVAPTSVGDLGAGGLTYDPNTGQFTFDPDGLPPGGYSMNVTVTDADGDTATETVTFTVVASNQPPTADDTSNSGLQGTVIPLTLTGSDSDGTVDYFTVDPSTLTTLDGTFSTDAAGNNPITSSTQITATGGQATIYFHPIADPANNPPDNDTVVGTFEYTAVDDDGDASSEATGTITYTDAVPTANPDEACLDEGEQSATVNLLFILDDSGSMGFSNGAKVAALKDAVKAVAEAYDDANIAFNISLVEFSSGSNGAGRLGAGVITNLTDLQTALNQLNTSGGTDYQIALNEAISVWNTDKGSTGAVPENSVAYFISDGEPNSGLGVGSGLESTWETYVENNFLKAIAVAIETTTIDNDLKPIAHTPGGPVGDSDDEILLADSNDLSDVLVGTVITPSEATGNLLYGSANPDDQADAFGADGDGDGAANNTSTKIVDVWLDDGNAVKDGSETTAAYDAGTSTYTVTLPGGLGTVTIDAVTGDYTVESDADVDNDETFQIGYTIQDADGSPSSSTLTVCITDSSEVVAVSDTVTFVPGEDSTVVLSAQGIDDEGTSQTQDRYSAVTDTFEVQAGGGTYVAALNMTEVAQSYVEYDSSGNETWYVDTVEVELVNNNGTPADDSDDTVAETITMAYLPMIEDGGAWRLYETTDAGVDTYSTGGSGSGSYMFPDSSYQWVPAVRDVDGSWSLAGTYDGAGTWTIDADTTISVSGDTYTITSTAPNAGSYYIGLTVNNGTGKTPDDQFTGSTKLEIANVTVTVTSGPSRSPEYWPGVGQAAVVAGVVYGNLLDNDHVGSEGVTVTSVDSNTPDAGTNLITVNATSGVLVVNSLTGEYWFTPDSAVTGSTPSEAFTYVIEQPDGDQAQANLTINYDATGPVASPGTAEAETVVADGSGGTTSAGDGDDHVIGTALGETLEGGADSDTLEGGDGDDVLYGGAGNDYLDGGLGADTLYGEAGDDIFVVGGGDMVMDFGDGNDVIDLDAVFEHLDPTADLSEIGTFDIGGAGDGTGDDVDGDGLADAGGESPTDIVIGVEETATPGTFQVQVAEGGNLSNSISFEVTDDTGGLSAEELAAILINQNKDTGEV